MKKLKNVLFLMSAFMLVNVLSINVNASEITLTDLVSPFNELAEDYNGTEYSISASMCTNEQIDADDCEDGDLVITTTSGESGSESYYKQAGNIISTYVDEDSALGLQIIVEAIGKVNNFNYNHKDLIATFYSEEILNYSVENEGIEITESESSEGLYEVKIDMTKKLPILPSKRLTVTYNGDGKLAVDDEVEAGEYNRQNTYSLVKKSSKHVLSAKADEGYKFVNWTLGGEEYSKEATITITVDEDMELVANFDLDTQEIKGAEVSLAAPKVGDSITKVIEKDEYGEWEGQSDFPEVSTETEGLSVYAYWVKGLEELSEEQFYGTFEKDTYYYVLIDFEADYGYELTEDFPDNIKVNGVKPEETFAVQMGKWNHCIAKVKAKEVISEYKILDGDNQTFETGKDLTIRANGYLEDFKILKLDGTEVASSNYTLKEGSTIVTLNASYLSTLSAGKHTLTFVYNNGSVDATFTIKAINNPATGDNMMLYISVLVLSIIGIACAGIYSTKKTLN